ncbi:DUF551 domain-containing protein [Klebsiella aerogenes]|uniref:DUF551 domain-containing protein n=1 Tax=Klebsiella aerogenes TaxID=548 RepID=UPI0025B56904|nr:DUF551 domain-containing protein [Klebsiella aerogenes]MDN3810027.1 DUF551 domain-containing protein [Klebsiella aerogenes]
MTKSTITREESVQAVFDLKVGYTLELADIEILKRVARMALAMLQAEPVTTANKLGKSPVIPDCYVMVPKEVTLEIGNAINVVGNRCTCGNCSQRLWDLLLAAAQHDTPALNPVQSVLSVQGWIPVSERLPEEGGRYWCYVEEQNSLGKSHYQWNCSWNGEIWGGAMMYGRVTHWMPLPNPPREVK